MRHLACGSLGGGITSWDALLSIRQVCGAIRNSRVPHALAMAHALIDAYETLTTRP